MTLSEVLLKMVQEAQGPCNMDDMVAILRKDAGECMGNWKKFRGV